MRVAEDLHLDMARAPDQLFEIDLVLAEGGLRLALGRGDGVEQICLAARSGACRARRRPRTP